MSSTNLEDLIWKTAEWDTEKSYGDSYRYKVDKWWMQKYPACAYAFIPTIIDKNPLALQEFFLAAWEVLDGN